MARGHYGWKSRARLFADLLSHWEKAKYKSIGSSTNTVMDLDDGPNFNITLSSNTALSFSNVSSHTGTQGTIMLKQDGAGGRTFTMPTAWRTPVGGSSIIQTKDANSAAILSYYIAESGVVLVNYIGGFE